MLTYGASRAMCGGSIYDFEVWVGICRVYMKLVYNATRTVSRMPSPSYNLAGITASCATVESER